MRTLPTPRPPGKTLTDKAEILRFIEREWDRHPLMRVGQWRPSPKRCSECGRLLAEEDAE